MRSDSSIVFFWGPPSAGFIGFFGRLDIVLDGIEKGKIGFLKLAKFNISSGDHEIMVKMGKNTSEPIIINVIPGEEKHFVCKLKDDFNPTYRPSSLSNVGFEILDYKR